MIDFVSGGVSIARARLARRLSIAGKAGFAVAIVTSYLGGVFGYGSAISRIAPGVAGMLNLAALAAIVASYAIWLTRTPALGRVVFAADTLHVARGSATRSVPRSAIRSAYVVRRAVGAAFVPTVEIALADGDLVAVRASSDAEAAALVAELGFGPGGAHVTVDVAAPTRRLFHPLLGIAAYYLALLAAVPLVVVGAALHSPAPGAAMGVVVVPVMLLVYRVLRSLLQGPKLTIGVDGVTWQSGRRKRFVPRAAIRGIDQQHPAMPIVIHTDTGPIVVNAAAIDAERRAAAARLLYERLATQSAVRARAPAFVRAGRPLAEWRAHLRQVVEDASYRSAGASLEDAAAVLGSPDATREERVGAALALRVAGEPPQRIRVAVAPSADDALREAVDAVLDERADDARVEKALRRIV